MRQWNMSCEFFHADACHVSVFRCGVKEDICCRGAVKPDVEQRALRSANECAVHHRL